MTTLARAGEAYAQRLEAAAAEPRAPLPYCLLTPPMEISIAAPGRLEVHHLRIAPARYSVVRQRPPITGDGVALEDYGGQDSPASDPVLPPGRLFYRRSTTRIDRRLECCRCGASPAWLVAKPYECLACAMTAATPRIIGQRIGRAETVGEVLEMLGGADWPPLVLIGTETLLARPNFHVKNGALINGRALVGRGVCPCVATEPGCTELYLYRAAADAPTTWRGEWRLPLAAPTPEQPI